MGLLSIAGRNLRTWLRWVPVDPGDVRKAMLLENLELVDRKTTDIAYFWGGIDPYRIKLAVGRDDDLNPQQAGKPLAMTSMIDSHSTTE